MDDLPPMPPLQRQAQVPFIPLSDLHLGHESCRVRVRASRVWQHRDGPGDREIQELRMVLVDDTGDSIYVVLPCRLLYFGVDVIQETKIYDLAMFEPVPLEARPKGFPLWTYRLTPIIILPDPTVHPTRCIDVMGVIRGISDVTTLAMLGKNVLASRRHVLIDDGSGNEIRITLWGESAFRLNGQDIRSLSEDCSAAAIFVGLTVSMVEGLKELSGSSACRWYINKDIEETNVFQTSLLSTFRPTVHLPPPRQMTLRAALDFHQPVRGLSKLLNRDDLQQQPSRFRCIVGIWRLAPRQRWWFPCCMDCGRDATPAAPSPAQAAKYVCSYVACPCTSATLQYRVHLLGPDSMGEAEFTLHGKLAQNLAGLSAQQLILNNLRADVDHINLVTAAATITHTPPELAAIVNWRYKLVLCVTPNCFQKSWARFYAYAVEDAYPPE